METKIPTEVGVLKVQKFGSVPVLEATKLPDAKEMGETDVLIKVDAAGISHFDLLLMSGNIPMPIKLPYIPGADCVGRVSVRLFRWFQLGKLHSS